MTAFPANLRDWDPARLVDQIDEASRAAHTPEGGYTEREWLEGLRYEDKFPDEPSISRPGYLPVLCECGHPIRDHRGGRSLAFHNHPVRPCLIDGCACSDFREPRRAA